MSTPTQTMPPATAPAQVPAPSSHPPRKGRFIPPQLVAAMLKSNSHVSDLIFSPGRAPQVEVSGQLTELKYKGLECLSSQDTLSIANDIMGKTSRLAASSSRMAQQTFPTESRAWAFPRKYLQTARKLRHCDARRSGQNPRIRGAESAGGIEGNCGYAQWHRACDGSNRFRKSSTLAAILDKMNAEKAYHILTIEDPIEFLHRHKKATIHQRELHSDTPTLPWLCAQRSGRRRRSSSSRNARPGND